MSKILRKYSTNKGEETMTGTGREEWESESN